MAQFAGFSEHSFMELVYVQSLKLEDTERERIQLIHSRVDILQINLMCNTNVIFLLCVNQATSG